MNERVLVEALGALEPIRERIVVVGGTAHRLFPFHEHGDEVDHDLLTTEDIDFAAPLELAYAGDEDLIGRLKLAGFNEEVTGAEYACHRYKFGETVATLQFLAPQHGSGRTRDGMQDRALRFSGIVAEKLKSVDILLHAPWALEYDERSNASVYVVNPLAFLAQKLLILPSRKSLAKRGKDALYIYDTLSIFSDHLDDLRASRAVLLPHVTRNQERGIDRAIERFFGSVGDAAREAERIAADQRPAPPSADSVVRACYSGLIDLFHGTGPGTD